MFNKNKSLKFYELMYRNKFGVNNSMYGKSRSPETLSKKVFVYNAETNLLIKEYDSIKETKKRLTSPKGGGI